MIVVLWCYIMSRSGIKHKAKKCIGICRRRVQVRLIQQYLKQKAVALCSISLFLSVSQKTAYMKKIFYLSALSICTLFSCTKNPVPKEKYVTLSYKQTYCADPWQNSSADSLTLLNVAAYLNASTLYIASLAIKQETAPDDCKACTCKTGKLIYVSTFNDEILKAKYSRIGFR